ncbi:unnamed protein product [Calypogeia fissa]
MASSNREPLLGQDDGDAESGSTSCFFDRFTHALKRIFSAHNLATAAGPVATAIIFCIAKYRGFDDGSGDMVASSKKIGAMLGALVWMAVWWVLEPVPIAITSLLPLVLFPFFEVMDSDMVAANYMNDTVVLMLGTFILALAINRYNLHKRMALKILMLVGGEEMNPRFVLLGFICGPAFVSMWMSNTPAAAMMIPMATGLLHNIEPAHHIERTKSKMTALIEEGKMEEDVDEHSENAIAKEAIRKYSQAVIIGVTYGIALGGMATLIGCGPNLVLPGIYTELFPGAPQVTFLQWMKFALPLVIIWMIPMWRFLCWKFVPQSAVSVIEASLNRNLVLKTYAELGSISFAEIFILVEFILLIALWITRSFGQTPGWGIFFENFPNEGTVAIAAAILLFVVPSRKKSGEKLMDWKACKDISWSVILLLGAGFALSAGIKQSGVSTWISINMQFFEYLPKWLVIPVLATLLSAATEFMSNAACATLFIPIFAEVAASIDLHPLFLMIPSVFASNYAFILPSGTPPNAVALGTAYVSVNDMAPPGLLMHALGILLLGILTPTLGDWVFGLNVPASSLPWLAN